MTALSIEDPRQSRRHHRRAKDRFWRARTKRVLFREARLVAGRAGAIPSFRPARPIAWHEPAVEQRLAALLPGIAAAGRETRAQPLLDQRVDMAVLLADQR